MNITHKPAKVKFTSSSELGSAFSLPLIPCQTLMPQYKTFHQNIEGW